MNKFTIAVDIDDVCAELVNTWLEWYNKDFNDNLDRETITDWDVSRFVKPECGRNIYRYIEMKTIYDEIVPVENAKEGVLELRELGHRVIFVTASPIEISGRKYRWLMDHGFDPKIEDYVEAYDKSLIRANYIFDDRYQNAANFNGVGILFTRPWNKKYEYYNRVNNWTEFMEKIYTASHS